jgi:hypothetical protein
MITLHPEMHREIDDSLQTRSAFPWFESYQAASASL